jgi:hypothetical protein
MGAGNDKHNPKNCIAIVPIVLIQVLFKIYELIMLDRCKDKLVSKLITSRKVKFLDDGFCERKYRYIIQLGIWQQRACMLS